MQAMHTTIAELRAAVHTAVVLSMHQFRVESATGLSTISSSSSTGPGQHSSATNNNSDNSSIDSISNSNGASSSDNTARDTV
eukprot:7067-Heterococcus_DN1.PRE.2